MSAWKSKATRRPGQLPAPIPVASSTTLPRVCSTAGLQAQQGVQGLQARLYCLNRLQRLLHWVLRP